MLAEMRLAKSAQLPRSHLSFPREIFLLQDALDPDVDRKGAEPLVGKQHHAIGNLRSHTRQLTKKCAQSLVRQFPPFLEVCFAGTDEACRREKIFRPIAQGTGAQIVFGKFRNPVRGRECVDFATRHLFACSVTLPQRPRHLADVRHLFHRRSDERRKTFPARLPNDPQSRTKIARGAHCRIVGEGATNLRERMIERKIMADDLRACAANEKAISSLLHKHSLGVDRSRVTLAAFFPMEDLAGIEGFIQVEIRSRDSSWKIGSHSESCAKERRFPNRRRRVERIEGRAKNRVGGLEAAAPCQKPLCVPVLFLSANRRDARSRL